MGCHWMAKLWHRQVLEWFRVYLQLMGFVAATKKCARPSSYSSGVRLWLHPVSVAWDGSTARFGSRCGCLLAFLCVLDAAPIRWCFLSSARWQASFHWLPLGSLYQVTPLLCNNNTTTTGVRLVGCTLMADYSHLLGLPSLCPPVSLDR